MTTAFNRNIVFTASALRRIAGVTKALKVKVQAWAFVVWTWVQGKAPRFVSKKEFFKQFVNFRKEGAKNCYVGYRQECGYGMTQHSVFSHGMTYIVTASKDSMACTCEDYKAQVAAWGRGCCKHGYAVLNSLGHQSLKDYIKAQ